MVTTPLRVDTEEGDGGARKPQAGAWWTPRTNTGHGSAHVSQEREKSAPENAGSMRRSGGHDATQASGEGGEKERE